MDWKNLVGQVAPMLGTALGGPLGGLAVQTIGGALGLDTKTEDTIKQAIAGATPEQMIAIKNADNDFALKMQQLGFDHVEKIAQLNASAAELDVKDRQGARDMQSATRSVTVPLLAYTIVGSFIAMVAGSLLGYSHVDSALAGTLVGYLSAKCEQVVAYYFGSSHGSQAKDAMLFQSTPNK